MLSYISYVQFLIDVDFLLSENYLYKPTWKQKLYLRLGSRARLYKSYIEHCCDMSGFHDYLHYIKSIYENRVVIVSEYRFLIPFNTYYVKSLEIARLDVTNMVKATEDSILGPVFDDKYVVSNCAKKVPIDIPNPQIISSYELFSFEL